MPTIDYNTIPKTTPTQGYGGGFGMVSGFGSPFGGVIVKIVKQALSGNGRPSVGIAGSRPRVNIVKVRPASRQEIRLESTTIQS